MAYTTGADLMEDPDPHAVRIATKRMADDAKDDDAPFRYPDEPTPEEPPPVP
jgi:hypothetical protein